MRRLALLVALTMTLVGVAIETTPTTAACTPPVCTLQDCDFIFEAPSFNPEEPDLNDIGLVGVECGDDEE